MISYMGPTYLTADMPDKAREWRNNPDIFKFCRQHSLISEQDQGNWHKWLDGNKNNKMFGIAIKEEKPFKQDPENSDLEYCDFDFSFGDVKYRYIGVGGLTSIDTIARYAEFSLYIAPEFQGKGYARSALYNLLKHGFDCFNLNKIWGEVFDTNKKGLHLFTDIFLMESRPGHRQHYFKNGKYLNTYIVDITAEEFRERVIPDCSCNKFTHELTILNHSNVSGFDDADISFQGEY